MPQNQPVQVTHEGLQALVSLPSGNAAGAPLLCFLHGYDEAAPMEIVAALTRHGPLSEHTPPALVADFVVVAPQLPQGGDVWHEQAEVVRSLVLRLQKEHGTDNSRRYLTGFSFGGNGVFDLGLAHPGFWTALWAVDPTRVPSSDLEEPVWLSIGSVARHATEQFIERLQSQLPDEELLADRIHLDEDEDHVGSARRAYADARIYRWLLERSKK
jgi:poly(3-hydroxybutyrate) depolymerase